MEGYCIADCDCLLTSCGRFILTVLTYGGIMDGQSDFSLEYETQQKLN